MIKCEFELILKFTKKKSQFKCCEIIEVTNTSGFCCTWRKLFVELFWNKIKFILQKILKKIKLFFGSISIVSKMLKKKGEKI